MPDDPADPVNPETDPGLKAHIDRGVDDRLRDLFIGDPDAWSRLKTAAARAVDRTIAEDLALVDRLRAAGIDLEALDRGAAKGTALTPEDLRTMAMQADAAGLWNMAARLREWGDDHGPGRHIHVDFTPLIVHEAEQVGRDVHGAGEPERADNTPVTTYTDDELADLADAALTPGRCTEQVGVLWVDCTNDHGTVIERRAIPLTCTVVNPLPALPFDHTHVYWDPIGGLAVTRQADPQRDSTRRAASATPPRSRPA